MNWFKNLRVAGKVFLCCTILLSFIAIIASYSIFQSKRASSQFNYFYSEQFLTSNDLNRILYDAQQIRINMLQEYIATINGDYEEVTSRRAQTKSLGEEYTAIWQKYRATNLSSDEKILADRWENDRAQTAEQRMKFMEAIDRHDYIASRPYLEGWAVEYRKFRDTNNDIINLLVKQGEETRNKETKAAKVSFIINIILALLSIVMGVIITYILSRSVSGPVNKGLSFAKKIANGDLTERIALNQNDELGLLGKELNKAADVLEHLISDVTLSANNLSLSVTEIANGNQNLSQRTTEQASSLEEIASTMEETSATIKQNSVNANEANTLSQKTSMLAEEGGSLVGDAVMAIEEINKSSVKIGEIISVINDIAFQTNLLALNAAVEAARAGEQGRGFAVVAGEVRNLAQRAAAASKEISNLIRESMEKVTKGTELASKSGESIKEIIAAVNQVNRVVAEIAAASDEQRQGIDQVTTAVTDLDTMTQQNAALVEETASASENMNGQAQDLVVLVEKFKIRT